MDYFDPWTAPLRRKGKKTISGGAARNVRIAEAGGMDIIIADAVSYALNRANQCTASTGKRRKTRSFIPPTDNSGLTPPGVTH